MRDTDDPYLLPDGEAARLLAAAPWKRFVAVGDSVAEGVTEPVPGYQTLGWFDHVAAQLRQARPGLAQLNLGKRNLFAAEVRATQLGPALEFAPDLAAVLPGGNDILQRTFDYAATRAEVATVIAALKEAGATILTMGLFDITVSPYVPEKYRAVMSKRIGQLGEMRRDLMAEFGGVYVDLPSHPAGQEDIFATDGLHLNARGQAIVAAEVVRQLGSHLAGA